LTSATLTKTRMTIVALQATATAFADSTHEFMEHILRRAIRWSYWL
jgi:hypothetical protein